MRPFIIKKIISVPPKTSFSIQEVVEHPGIVVSLQEKAVYDLTHFLNTHPGGKEALVNATKSNIHYISRIHSGELLQIGDDVVWVRSDPKKNGKNMEFYGLTLAPNLGTLTWRSMPESTKVTRFGKNIDFDLDMHNKYSYSHYIKVLSKYKVGTLELNLPLTTKFWLKLY